MNLIEISSNLKQLLNKLAISKRDLGPNNDNYEITDWMVVSNSLHSLSNYSFFKDQIQYIFTTNDLVYVRSDRWLVSKATFGVLSNRINTLKESIKSCISLIDEYTSKVYEIPENSGLINVKMPDKIDMVKMSDICNDIDIVFAQCPLIKDEVKFIGVEKGSVFFVFVTAVTSVKTIGMILNIALDLQKKYFQNQILKNKLETMISIKDFVEKAKKELDDEVKEYCKEKVLGLDESKNLDPEEQTRFIISIETLSDLINKGVQMECTLSEGEEGESDVVSLFPKLEDFKNIIEATKLIE